MNSHLWKMPAKVEELKILFDFCKDQLKLKTNDDKFSVTKILIFKNFNFCDLIESYRDAVVHD